MTVKGTRPLSGTEMLKALGGRVQSDLLNREIRLTAEVDGRPRPFVVDHNGDFGDLLVVKQRDPIKLKLSAAWPRAVIVELSLSGRKPRRHGDEAHVIARAELFLAHPGVQRVVVVDRWEGAGNRALQAASAASAEMLGGIIVAGAAPHYTLTIKPVQTAVAAGMMWDWNSADLPLDEVLDFDAMLRRFPPWAKVHDPPSLEAFRRMRADLARITRRLDETEARIGRLPAAAATGASAAQAAYPGQILTSPDDDDGGDAVPVSPGRIVDPSGTDAALAQVEEMLGGFVRGDALPARAGLPFVPRELGAETTFGFRLLVCADESQIQPFAAAAGAGRR